MSFIEKVKDSRKLSFIALTIIYVAATVVGVVTYSLTSGEFWVRLLIADVVATVFTFIFSLIFKNASVYDPYWSVQPPVILTAFALGQEITPVRLLLLVAVWIWGIRLTGNWAYTFHGLNFQDWRYTMLEQKTGNFYPFVNFAGIHMVPTLVVWACILPAVVAMRETAELNIGSILFFFVSFGAAMLQFFADHQMHQYRKNRNGVFMRNGLWKNSRHPNYLGEILMWWGVALSVIIVLPQYWYLCAGAVANTLMFRFISIPMADNRQKNKPGFDEYISETSMLFSPFKH